MCAGGGPQPLSLTLSNSWVQVWASEHIASSHLWRGGWGLTWAQIQAIFIPALLLFFQEREVCGHLVWFSSVTQSDSLRPHGLQHAMPPCPSPTPGVYSNSCPLRQWCHPTISSSVIPFSSCLQSFPASGSFPVDQLFASGGQRFGATASTSVLPMNTEDWSPLGWNGWISPCLSRFLKKTANCFLYAYEFFMQDGEGVTDTFWCILAGNLWA